MMICQVLGRESGVMKKLYDISKGHETRLRIVAAMVELGRETPLASQRVGAICEAACVSRQTFYSHFADKYDAVNWYSQQLSEAMEHVIANGMTWYEAGIAILTRTQEEREFYDFALKSSEDYNSLAPSLMRTYYDSWHQTLTDAPGFHLTERLDYQLRAFSRIGLGLVHEWIAEGCTRPIDETAELIVSCIPAELREATDAYVAAQREAQSM